MKKFCLYSMICFFLLPFSVFAEEVHIYLFYGDTCSICEKERAYLEVIKSNYDQVHIFEFETFHHEENERYMQQIKKMYSIKGDGVPFTVVGDTGIYGFHPATQSKIESAIKKYSKEDYYDRVGVYLGLFEDEEIVVSPPVSEIIQSHQNTIEKPKNQHFLSFWIIFFLFLFCLFEALISLFRKRNFYKK